MSTANIDVAHQDKYQQGAGRLHRCFSGSDKEEKQMNRFESVTKPAVRLGAAGIDRIRAAATGVN